MLMFLAALSATALAGSPVDQDASAYEARWQMIQDGPAGCWEVTGRATWSWDAGIRGASQGDSMFVGHLEDGVWKDFLVKSLGEDQRDRAGTVNRVFQHGEQTFVPLVGRMPTHLTGLTADSNALSWTLKKLGGDVEFADAENDEARGGVILNRTVPLDGATEPVKMEVFFPGGGSLPSTLKVRFPESFSLPSFRLAKVRDARALIRGRAFNGEVVPEAETFSFDAGVLGVHVVAAQTIRYQTFRPCGMSAIDETKPIGVPADPVSPAPVGPTSVSPAP